MYLGQDGLWRVDHWDHIHKCVVSEIVIKKPREYWLVATDTDTHIMTSLGFAEMFLKNRNVIGRIIHVREVEE